MRKALPPFCPWRRTHLCWPPGICALPAHTLGCGCGTGLSGARALAGWSGKAKKAAQKGGQPQWIPPPFLALSPGSCWCQEGSAKLLYPDEILVHLLPLFTVAPVQLLLVLDEQGQRVQGSSHQGFRVAFESLAQRLSLGHQGPPALQKRG